MLFARRLSRGLGTFSRGSSLPVRPLARFSSSILDPMPDTTPAEEKKLNEQKKKETDLWKKNWFYYPEIEAHAKDVEQKVNAMAQGRQGPMSLREIFKIAKENPIKRVRKWYDKFGGKTPEERAKSMRVWNAKRAPFLSRPVQPFNREGDDLIGYEKFGKDALARGDTRHAYGLHKDAGAVGSLGVLDTFGLWPFVFVGVTYAISKELLYLNAELVVQAAFVASFTGLYYFVFPHAKAAISAFHAQKRHENEAWVDMYRNDEKFGYRLLKKIVKAPEDARAIAGVWLETMKRFHGVRPFIEKRTITQKIDAMLEYYMLKEKAYLDSFIKSTADKSIDFVEKQLSNKDTLTKTQAQFTDFALDSLAAFASGQTKSLQDPIQLYLVQYFQELERHLSFIKAEHANYIKKFEADPEGFKKDLPAILSKIQDPMLREMVAAIVIDRNPDPEKFKKLTVFDFEMLKLHFGLTEEYEPSLREIAKDTTEWCVAHHTPLIKQLGPKPYFNPHPYL